MSIIVYLSMCRIIYTTMAEVSSSGFLWCVVNPASYLKTVWVLLTLVGMFLSMDFVLQLLSTYEVLSFCHPRNSFWISPCLSKNYLSIHPFCFADFYRVPTSLPHPREKLRKCVWFLSARPQEITLPLIEKKKPP